jgi:hypothetical protein
MAAILPPGRLAFAVDHHRYFRASAGIGRQNQAIRGQKHCGWVLDLRIGRYFSMKSKGTRLALMGVLALAISVTVGLVSGSVADAKKKKSKRSFTITKTAPTIIPGAPGPAVAVVKVPIGTVGKKIAKGKVVSLNGATVTTTFTGSPGFASSIGEVDLIGPSGRQAFLTNPLGNGSNTETSSGPLTETPNSSASFCVPSTPAPPPPCPDPDRALGPPYSGTIGNEALLNFSGSAAVGTWFIKVIRGAGANPITLGAVKVTGGLITKPQ